MDAATATTAVLPADVPQVSCGVQLEQSISDGELMKRRSLLVAEVRIWNPEVFPAAVVQSDLGLVMNRRER